MKPIPSRSGNEGEELEEIAGDESESPTEDEIMAGEEQWIQAHEFK